MIALDAKHPLADGWYVTAPFSSPEASALAWDERSLLTDAIWGLPGYVRPRAFGAPWETVILLAQESQGTGVWINVPVEVCYRRGVCGCRFLDVHSLPSIL